MPVVRNTSPILNLAIINRLDLLRQQFGEVLIPPAVLSELKADTDFPGADRIREALLQAWLQARELTNVNLARVLNRDLDQGEGETIALALQFGLDTVLMDEHDGRVAAKAMGLTPVGILGVLVRAKRAGALESVESAMRALQDEAGFYIADDLFDAVLREAGER